MAGQPGDRRRPGVRPCNTRWLCHRRCYSLSGRARLDLSVAMALFDVHVALYVVSWALSVIFLMATAAQAFRSRELPVWLSVAAVLIALVNLAAVAGPTTPLASFPNLLMWLWTLATSITFLIRRPIAAVN